MKKLLSALLAFAIVLTSLCIPAVATEDKSATPPTTSTAQTLLPAYTAASSSAKKTYTDTYNDCILMTVTNTTRTEYTAYLDTLESQNYTKVLRGHKILGMTGDASNLSSIYTKGNDYLINALWVPSTKEVKVTIEPLNGLDLNVFKSTNATTGSYSSLIIQIGLDGHLDDNEVVLVEGQTDDSSFNGGMSYAYRLSDGRFVIFDGGGGNCTGSAALDINHAARIYNTLKKYNATANGGKGGEIVIAAWYISHPHTDHMGAFMAFTARYMGNTYNENVRLERVISYMPNIEEQTYKLESENYSLSSDKIATYNARLQDLDAQGVHIYKAHVGQKYYIGNMTIEILYTYDLLSPTMPEYLFETRSGEDHDPYGYKDYGKVHNATGGGKDLTNSFSVISQLTLKIAGKSEPYKVIMTGDATVFGIETVNKLYGAAMKSDFVQVPHHGSTQMSASAEASGLTDADRYDYQVEVDLFFGDMSGLAHTNYYSAGSNSTLNPYGYVCAKYVLWPCGLKQAQTWIDGLPGDDEAENEVRDTNEVLTGYTTNGTANDSRCSTWSPIIHLQEEVEAIGGKVFVARNFLTVITLDDDGTPSSTTDTSVISNSMELPEGEDGDYKLIYSAQDLAALSSTGKGKLAKDIYIQNPTSTVCAKDFKGELDGDGHTIYVSYTNGKTTNFAKTAGFLFSTLNDGANVHDLTLDGVNVTASATAANIGLLAYNVNGTVVIDNVHIQNATVTDSSARNTNIGGMIPSTAATANVTVKNSSFHGTIQAGTSTIASTVGGIFGRAGASEAGATKILIKNCEVGGSISHNKIAGGIVGNVNITADGSFEVNNCQNNAYVAALLAGGIVGNLADGTAVHTKLLNCVNTGDIECTSSNAADTTKSASEGNAGGAIGKATCASTATVTVTSFYNSGDILVKGGAATSTDEIKKNNARIGSVIGRVGASGLTPTLNITGAVNSGNVEADAVFEGIYIGHAGSAKNYTVTNAVNLNATVKSNGLVPGGQGNGNVTQPNVTDHSDKRFDTLTGARIRLSDTAADSGLRFDIVVDQALITALEDAGFTVKFGSLAAKADNVTGEFTKEAMDAAGKKYSDVSVAEDDAALRVLKNSIDATAYGYTAALINITSYNTIYACVGYLELTNAEGFSACIYTDYNATENARSVAFVANAALDDSTVTFTAEQTAILNTFAGN
ncbi:MAG: hypothetical protein IKA05_03760 [Clostridia bacterium]|nr:hypothetical protein [Clostridia bacterium]